MGLPCTTMTELVEFANSTTPHREENQMRSIKLFGLAAVAALAATAFIGPPSASATWTVLCKTSEPLACPAANEIVLKKVHFVALDGKLLSSLGTILCEEALIVAETLHLAKPLLIHPSELVYKVCSLGSTSCEVKTTHLGLLHLLKIGVDIGELLDLEEGGSFTRVSVVCGKLVNCEYEGQGLVGEAVGGNPSTVTYKESVVNKVAGGFLCPETSKLDAVFKSLEALHIAE